MDPAPDRRARPEPRGGCVVCDPAPRLHAGSPRSPGVAVRPRPRGAPPPPLSDNAMLSWMRGLPGTAAAHLDRLNVLDGALAAVFGEGLDLRDPERRRAFALFLEFARHHGLSAGEAALLLHEPLAAAAEALGALAREAARAAAARPA